MSDTQELSKQQLKSKETKGRIFRAAKTILQEKGYEVILRKRDGFEVLSAIQDEHPDLVIMDTQMRHVDAIAVINTLSSESQLPYFIITLLPSLN